MLLSFLKKRLEKWNGYISFRYHPSTISLWLKLRPSVARTLSHQKNFYQKLLETSNGNLIIDVGANEGFITQIFAELGFKVIAIEPSSRSVRVLKARFYNNANVIIIPLAVSNKKGRELFFESQSDHAINTFSEKWKNISEVKIRSKLYNDSLEIDTITLDEIVQRFGVPAFIKIDVEGYEENVLKGLSQQVPLLSFEAILPHFLSETISCIEHVYWLCNTATFNYVVDNKLVFEFFVPREQIVSKIQSLSPQTVEIICKC